MKQAFAGRLVEAMLANGHRSARNAKSGVDVAPLAQVAKVTREMARRYTQGTAMPDAEKIAAIAHWLGVRTAWLRDGDLPREGPSNPSSVVAQLAPPPYLSADAIEIARVWLKLTPERKAWFRDLMCLEAAVAQHYPWLMFGRPKQESYNEYEQRIENDILRLAGRLMSK